MPASPSRRPAGFAIVQHGARDVATGQAAPRQCIVGQARQGMISPQQTQSPPWRRYQTHEARGKAFGPPSGSNMTFESRRHSGWMQANGFKCHENLIHQQESSGSKRSIRTTRRRISHISQRCFGNCVTMKHVAWPGPHARRTPIHLLIGRWAPGYGLHSAFCSPHATDLLATVACCPSPVTSSISAGMSCRACG